MAIKKGDVVVRFDPMTVQRTLNDRRSEFKQADEEIGKTRRSTAFRSSRRRRT